MTVREIVKMLNAFIKSHSITGDNLHTKSKEVQEAYTGLIEKLNAAIEAEDGE